MQANPDNQSSASNNVYCNSY